MEPKRRRWNDAEVTANWEIRQDRGNRSTANRIAARFEVRLVPRIHPTGIRRPFPAVATSLRQTPTGIMRWQPLILFPSVLASLHPQLREASVPNVRFHLTPTTQRGPKPSGCMGIRI